MVGISNRGIAPGQHLALAGFLAIYCLQHDFRVYDAFTYHFYNIPLSMNIYPDGRESSSERHHHSAG